MVEARLSPQGDHLVNLRAFTVCYPMHHRVFTSALGRADNFQPPVDAHSLRSYQVGGYAEDTDVSLTTPEIRPLVEHGPVLRYGNLEIRPDEIQVLAGSRRVGLTVREFEVLLVLAEREDRVVRRAELYDRVWGGAMKRRDRSVDVFVRKVRVKLAHASPGWEYIHTHFGVGYRFSAIPPPPANA